MTGRQVIKAGFMMKPFFACIPILFFCLSHAQTSSLPGIVEDARTHEPLAGASITLFESSGVLGSISNGEGKFFIHNADKLDSIRFSMIGYRSKLYKMTTLSGEPFLTVNLEAEPSVLKEVMVRPLGAMDIVTQAAQKIPSMIPPNDFESRAFYREIIRDSLRYYSVAEAIFSIQFAVHKKSFALKLDKGRSKEDVSYTRLFEDFHPGGGPEDAVSQSLVVRRPDFLNLNSLKNYIYKKDSTIRLDDAIIYVISFDQKPGLNEALEKGKMYINADDFSLLKFEAENSPAGTPFIKSLKGTDKIFAEILHIDFTLKGWARTADFTKIGDKVFLAHAKMVYDIGYKQPKKELDLDLNINTELLITDFRHPVVDEIHKGEEWKRKNLVANLPTDFDTAFWGTNNTLSPTTEINNIIALLSKKNNDVAASASLDGWQYLNRGFFTAWKNGDIITLVPLAKCSWEDNEAGGMIYKNMDGDFSIETKLSISKRSNPSLQPDNGFQQCGIIVRSTPGKEENHLIFSMGTGGNDKPKIFLKRTIAGKTKGLVDKTDSLSGWLRIEKRGKLIHVYRKPDKDSEWIKADDYEYEWLKGDVQVGFSIMARFAGDGPRQRPDMKAVFSNIKISSP